MITVFTPTYNRAYTLGKLYTSLCEQTFCDFEWVVVNDGSTDNTDELLHSFISENKIAINYFPKENGGKHTAINYGIPWAKGKWLMIVDSDDYLHDQDVLKTIDEKLKLIENRVDFCGIVGNRVYENGKTIGSPTNYDTLETNFVEYREKYGIKGDRAEVVLTSVMREFPLLEVEGEKYCPESYMWVEMALKYKALYLNIPFVTCEYMADGITLDGVRIAQRIPTLALRTYAQYVKHPYVKAQSKIKHTILYWCYSFDSNKPFSWKVNLIGTSYLWLYPVGWLYRRIKKIKKIKKLK